MFASRRRGENDRIELSLSRLAAPQKRREQVVRAENPAVRGFRPRSANADASHLPAAALRVSAQFGRSNKKENTMDLELVLQFLAPR